MISETDILKTFQHLVKRSDADESIIIGSGDDAAVINIKDKCLVHSVDISKINSHFPRNFLPNDIAYRSIAIALSDLAAMGAYPSFITIGLTCDEKKIEWYERFSKGVEESMNEFNFSLVGGDITYGELSVCVNVFGYLFDKPLLRSGAKPGDKIFITGQLGHGQKGLEDFKRKNDSISLEKFKKPTPQFKKSKHISSFASSCVDISDGLIKDLNSICRTSQVGAKIIYEDIPKLRGIDDLSHGDDFELCFTTSDKNIKQLNKDDYFCIGEITSNKEITLLNANKEVKLEKDGWDSFK